LTTLSVPNRTNFSSGGAMYVAFSKTMPEMVEYSVVTAIHTMWLAAPPTA
jgi:hypothetical protein